MAAISNASNKKSCPTWICPAPRPLIDEEKSRAADVYSSVSQMQWFPDGPVGVAGLELQTALMAMNSNSGLKPADNSFWAAKCQALLIRPAIEPIACSYWTRLANFDLDENSALLVACTMAGRRLVYRTSAATGQSIKGDVAFEPVDMASRWLAKIKAAAEQPELREALPMYGFAQSIMAHPFSDGNGRFARLMVHAALARTAGLRLPAVALAPAFYRNGDRLGQALTALGRSRDWGPFNALFLSVLEEAVDLARALQRQRRGPG